MRQRIWWWLRDKWQSVLFFRCAVFGHCLEAMSRGMFWCKRCGELQGDIGFADCVNDVITNHTSGKRVLAEKFQVAESTVERWANGTATPHPDMQEKVLVFLVEEDIEELDGHLD